MKIMTLNLNFYVEKHGPWTKRSQLIANAVRRLDPDVLALQAVRADPTVEEGRNQAEQLRALLPSLPYAFFQPLSSSSSGQADGMAFLSRAPFLEKACHRLARSHETEDKMERALLETGIDRPGGRVRLFDAHVSWVPIQAAENIGQIIEKIVPVYGQAILLGDFNARPDSDLVKRVASHGWIDAWAAVRPKDAGYTFESDAPSQRIDYIWTSPSLADRVRDVELVEESEDGVRMSDHLGLAATVAL